ncbi:MAG: hypothetical protein ABSB53_00505 [Nitrososphaerales archaeon]
MDKRRTQLRTFRFSESLMRSLEKEAADEDTSVNALASSIISGYFDWDKKAREFGFISLHKPIFMRLIEELDDETLDRIGREVMASTWKEMAEFWLQDSSPEKMLEVLSMRSKINPSRLRTRITREENKYTIILRHDFGPKWSIVEKSALQEFVRKTFLVEPQISQGESVVMARFTVNPHDSLS